MPLVINVPSGVDTHTGHTHTRKHLRTKAISRNQARAGLSALPGLKMGIALRWQSSGSPMQLIVFVKQADILKKYGRD